MLFRPGAEQNLEAVHGMLESWNVEADRFRQAALAGRSGDAPSTVTAAAAEEAHDGLMSLLSEIDDALDKVSAGSPQFGVLLKAQMTAVALLESIGNSFDILDRLVATQATAPTRIAHKMGGGAQ